MKKIIEAVVNEIGGDFIREYNYKGFRVVVRTSSDGSEGHNAYPEDNKYSMEFFADTEEEMEEQIDNFLDEVSSKVSRVMVKGETKYFVPLGPVEIVFTDKKVAEKFAKANDSVKKKKLLEYLGI